MFYITSIIHTLSRTSLLMRIIMGAGIFFIGGAIFFLSVSSRADSHLAFKTEEYISSYNTYPPITLSDGGDMLITLSGVVESIFDADIAAEVSGIVMRTMVDEGDAVKQGDLLLEIDHARVDAQLVQARATYQKAYTAWSSGITTNALSSELSQKEAKTSTVSAQATLDRALRVGVDTAKSVLLSSIDALVILAENEDVVNDSFYNEYYVRTQKSAAISILLGKENAGRYDASFIPGLFGGVRESLTTLSEGHTLDAGLVKATLLTMREGLSALLSAYEELQGGVYYAGSTTPEEQAVFESGERSVREGITLLASLEGSIIEAEEAYNNTLILGDVSVQSTEELALAENDMHLHALSEASAKIAELEAVREYAFVRAPFDGVVSEMFVSEGDGVQPGASLVSLAGDTEWKIVTDIADTYHTLLETGSPAYVHIEGVSEVLSGAVHVIVPAVDKDSHSMRVEVAIPEHTETLYPGLFARVELLLSSPSGAYILPREYVGYDYDGPYLTTEEGVRMSIDILRDTGERVLVQPKETFLESPMIVRP